MQQGLPRLKSSGEIIKRETVGDINDGVHRVALVKLNEIALTFESRAGGRHRCDMVLSLSTALALDAQSRR